MTQYGIIVSHKVVYCDLYNNQISTHALIGQSAMAYCAGKPMEKSARLLYNLYKSSRPQVSMAYLSNRPQVSMG